MPNYIVNARIPEGADQDTLVTNFARAFGVSEAKARGRLGKLPGRVSKPVTDREAQYLAKRFDKIGLLTDIVAVATTNAITADEQANTPAWGSDASAHPDSTDTTERNPDSTDGAARLLRDTHDSDASGAPQRPAKIDREAATRALAAAAMPTIASADPAVVGLNPDHDPAAPHLAASASATKTTKSKATKPKQTPLAVRFGVRKKLLLTALAPSLLVLLLGLSVVALRLPPLLQRQQETTSDAIATTLATSIAALLASPLESANNQALLQQWLERTQAPLAEQNIDALLVSDLRGQVLAGWFADDMPLNNLPLTLQATLQAEVARASARFAAEQSGVMLGSQALPTPVIGIGQREVALHARVITQSQDGTPSLVGAVIVGSRLQPNQQATRNVLLMLLLLALVPLVLGAGLALWLGTRMRKVVRALLARVDRRYADSSNTTPESHDELGLLAHNLRHISAPPAQAQSAQTQSAQTQSIQGNRS